MEETRTMFLTFKEMRCIKDTLTLRINELNRYLKVCDNKYIIKDINTELIYLQSARLKFVDALSTL